MHQKPCACVWPCSNCAYLSMSRALLCYEHIHILRLGKYHMLDTYLDELTVGTCQCFHLGVITVAHDQQTSTTRTQLRNDSVHLGIHAVSSGYDDHRHALIHQCQRSMFHFTSKYAFTVHQCHLLNLHIAQMSYFYLMILEVRACRHTVGVLHVEKVSAFATGVAPSVQPPKLLHSCSPCQTPTSWSHL